MFSRKSDDGQSKSEADALVEALTAKFEEKLTERLNPLSEKVNSISDKWNKMEKDAEEELVAARRKSEDDNLTDDEKKTKREQAERVALFASTVQANARHVENACIAGIASEYPELVAELQQVFDTTNWQRKAEKDYAQYCQNVTDMLIGRKARKSGLRYDRNSSKFMIEDAAAKTGGAKSPLADPDLSWTDPHSGKTLTASEQLAKLGIDPEKFAERMKSGVV